MSNPNPQHDIRLLLLTMPGFGIETLRQLDRAPRWPAKSVLVGMIGRRPDWLRWLAARTRFQWRGIRHPHAWLSEGALAGMEARQWLASRRYQCRWLERDEDVRRLRAEWAPDLTLTITSRILFKERTLNEGAGDWLNVHPGLLPRYAGASPGPYMFLDGTAGCTIHRMAKGVDTGAIVDIARIDGDLGIDGGALLYERLPRLAAERIVAVLQCWRDGPLESREQDPSALRYCTSAQLRLDRQLDWSLDANVLVRWVRALMPFAPAWFIDSDGRHCQVRAAVAHTDRTVAAPGAVLEKQGDRVRVACSGGSVWLECCARPEVGVGGELQGGVLGPP